MKMQIPTDIMIEKILKRQAALAQALRLQKDKRKAIQQREYDRRVGIVGRAVLANAAQSAEFKEFLKGILRATVTAEAEVKFLIAQNFYE
jgi:hypothetical protein